MEINLASIRQEYTKGGLRESELPDNPFLLFSQWLQEAIDSKVDEPTAMLVGTVSPEGKLLYQRDQFFYLRHESIPIRFSGNKHKLTRDILHVYGKIITGDTLDVFVCHFPSRYGGEKESEKDRFDAARTLRGSSDSLLLIREKPQILIMGDFNDTPQDRSISEIFAAQAFPENTQITDSTSCTYYNLFASPHITQFPGSHKYQGEWSQLDQIIVNRDLITQESSMHIIPESIHIFAPDFLLTKDKTWRGVRPFRTYYGFKYEGGFSDHLPLTVDFLIRSQIKR